MSEASLFDGHQNDSMEYTQLLRHSSTISIIFCVVYMMVFVVGLIGNLFVISVVFRVPRMRTVTNLFIANLAIADVLVIVFCVPATLMSNLFVRKYRVGVDANLNEGIASSENFPITLCHFLFYWQIVIWILNRMDINFDSREILEYDLEIRWLRNRQRIDLWMCFQCERISCEGDENFGEKLFLRILRIIIFAVSKLCN